MRKRIYWLLPDLNSARRTMDDLLLARIDERHVHFLAAEGTDMRGLHEANLLQTSDIVRAAEMGLVVGGAVGMLAGFAAALFPIIGESPQWGMVGVLTIVGGLFGTWTASMIGSSTRNGRIKRFESVIAQGQILLMLDVPSSQVEDIEALLRKQHPEARFEGLEAAIPAFP